MQCHNAVLALALTLLLVGCAGESAVQAGTAAVEVTLLGVEGQEVGRIALTPEDGKVRIQASLEALQPGFHGFHVHDVGVCDPDAPDGPFTTAGGHYVGGGGDHGEHAGDLPSPYAADDGIAELTTVTEAFTLDELRDGDGSALVIHAGRDNFANIPDRYTSSESGQPGPDQMTLAAGDSGSRFACGVIDGTGGIGPTVPAAVIEHLHDEGDARKTAGRPGYLAGYGPCSGGPSGAQDGPERVPRAGRRGEARTSTNGRVSAPSHAGTMATARVLRLTGR